MRTRASKRQEVDDFIVTARRVVEHTIGEPLAYASGIKQGGGGRVVESEPPIPPPHKKNPHAVALSRLGASKGGRARADQLTSEQRRAIALRAARARWGKRKGEG
jgi:hypothetical protein